MESPQDTAHTNADTPGASDAAAGDLLRTADVASMFGIDPQTVAHWEGTGRLTYVHTANGPRVRKQEIESLLADSGHDTV